MSCSHISHTIPINYSLTGDVSPTAPPPHFICFCYSLRSSLSCYPTALALRSLQASHRCHPQICYTTFCYLHTNPIVLYATLAALNSGISVPLELSFTLSYKTTCISRNVLFRVSCCLLPGHAFHHAFLCKS